MKELNTEHSGTEENKTHLALDPGNESILIQLVVANIFLEEESFICDDSLVAVLIFLRGHRQIHAHILTSRNSFFKIAQLLGQVFKPN